MTNIKSILSDFYQETGIKFNDSQLLIQALTHTSFAYENNHKNHYERLEFLGDAILELVISEKLYSLHPNFTEGQLTRLRADIVRKKTLVQIATSLKINNFVLLGRGEKLAGGQKRGSLLADVLEAVIGAIYLDSSLEKTRDFILKHFSDVIASRDIMHDDYKTRLQETMQSKSKSVNIEYILINSSGPDHDKEFEIGLYIDGTFETSGIGKSKKAAEQNAASKMLVKLHT